MSCENRNGLCESDEIPVIDLSQVQPQLVLEDKDYCQEESSVYMKVRRACEEWGCFQVINHGISEDLLQMDTVCREMFRLPQHTKEKNVSSSPSYGYLGPSPLLPFYESLGMAGVPHPEAIQHFSDQLWPHGNPNFCKTTEDYTSKMESLTKTLFKIVLIGAGLSKYYKSYFDNCNCLLRVNHYSKPSEEPTESLALAAHTDPMCMTIINQDSMGGLEVLSNEGQWVAAKPLPDSFVVVIGDSFMGWSNRKFHNVKHRVIIDGWKTRLSLAFAAIFPDELEINPPPELVDDEHPQLYRTFKYGEYRAFREGKYREFKERTGTTIDSPLDIFAGISKNE
eukprot:Gb_26939 [translate_table: standard]